MLGEQRHACRDGRGWRATPSSMYATRRVRRRALARCGAARWRRSRAWPRRTGTCRRARRRAASTSATAPLGDGVARTRRRRRRPRTRNGSARHGAGRRRRRSRRARGWRPSATAGRTCGRRGAGGMHKADRTGLEEDDVLGRLASAAAAETALPWLPRTTRVPRSSQPAQRAGTLSAVGVDSASRPDPPAIDAAVCVGPLRRRAARRAALRCRPACGPVVGYSAPTSMRSSFASSDRTRRGRRRNTRGDEREPARHRTTMRLARTWVTAGADHGSVAHRCQPNRSPAARSSGSTHAP